MWSHILGPHCSLYAFASGTFAVYNPPSAPWQHDHFSSQVLHTFETIGCVDAAVVASTRQLNKLTFGIIKWCHIRCEGRLGSVGCSHALSAESSCACGRNFGQRALSIGCTRELARRSRTVMNVDQSALFCSGIICHAEDVILTPEKCDRTVTAWSFCSVR